jgi:hypothetical protein
MPRSSCHPFRRPGRWPRRQATAEPDPSPVLAGVPLAVSGWFRWPVKRRVVRVPDGSPWGLVRWGTPAMPSATIARITGSAGVLMRARSVPQSGVCDPDDHAFRLESRSRSSALRTVQRTPHQAQILRRCAAITSALFTGCSRVGCDQSVDRAHTRARGTGRRFIGGVLMVCPFVSVPGARIGAKPGLRIGSRGDNIGVARRSHPRHDAGVGGFGH